MAITNEVASSGPKAWVTLPFPQSIKMPASPEFNSRETEGVSLTGGRYWFCVFTEDATTLWRTDAKAQPDGTQEGEGVSLCQTTEAVSYVANSAAFPPMDLACVSVAGQFSVYGSVTNMDMSPYRSTFGDCTMFRNCGACSKAGSNDAFEKTHQPCDWVRSTDGDEKCMARSDAYSQGLTQVTCSKSWALGNYMDLDTWSCAEATNQYLEYGNLMPPSSSDRTTPATLELCAEACYFANMHWVGWTGSYANGMDANLQQNAAVNGRPDAIDSNQPPFFCEGFDFEDQSKCNLFKTPAVLQPSGGAAGTCYVNKDNPNPCNLGSSNTFKWIKSTDGKFYFVPSTDGLMEYVQVGPNGPPSCGTGTNVFASNNWMTGADTTGKFMPNPALTCDASSDKACQRCLAHSLSRSMVIGTLDASSSTATNPQCKLMTAFRKASECTDGTASISCPAGDRIRILTAFYGRQKGSDSCAFAPASSSTLVVPDDDDMPDCWTDIADQVQTTCESTSDCSVYVGREFASDKDACTDIFSYADIRYSCESGDASSLSAGDER